MAGYGEFATEFRDRDGGVSVLSDLEMTGVMQPNRCDGQPMTFNWSAICFQLVGLRHVTGALGEMFVQGLVLHDAERPVPFGERTVEMPVSASWS